MRKLVFLLFVLMVETQASGNAAERKVLVRDDGGTGIKSGVFLNSVSIDNKQGSTDEHGEFELRRSCGDQDKIVADPDDPFYHVGDADCSKGSDPITIKVTRMEFAENLISNAQYFASSGKPAKAAFILTEYAERIEASDPQKAERAREKSLQLFGQYLKIGGRPTSTFDPEQGKNVMSPELEKALKKWQTQSGVLATGKLDYKTLSKAARADIYPYLVERKE
jgi:hypothetical protein